MSNFEYTAIFFQISDQDFGDRKTIDFQGSANSHINKASLKYWASNEMEAYFKCAFAMGGSSMRIFNWNKPIYAEVFCNGEFVVLFEQLAVNKDRIIKDGVDFPYKLRKRQYILVEVTAVKPFKQRGEKSVKEFEYTNLDKLLNSVEYQTRAKPKFPTPIIYTPMK